MDEDEKIAMFTTLSRIECLIMAIMRTEYGDKETIRVHKKIAKDVSWEIHEIYEEAENEGKRSDRGTKEPKSERRSSRNGVKGTRGSEENGKEDGK